MKRFFKTCLIAILSVLIICSNLFFTTPVVADSNSEDFSVAQEWPVYPNITASAGIVMEASTGAILYNKNMNNKMYPASITKILTGLVALENSSLDDDVSFSANALDLESGAATLGVNVGETISMKDALYALLLYSSNDAAVAISETVSGSVASFTNLMNERATEAGAINSHFANPNGLYNEDHYTTCYDMAMITKAAIQNQTFLQIDSTLTYKIVDLKSSDEPIEFSNRHKMFFPSNENYYEGIIAGKTGYISQAGRTLVTVARKNGMTLISVIMNSTTENQWSDATQLLDFGFNNFTLLNISKNESHFSFGSSGFLAAAGSVFSDNEPNIIIDSSASIVLPKGASFSDAVPELCLIENDDGKIATLTYTYAGEYVGETIIEMATDPVITDTSPYLEVTEDKNTVGPSWQIRINIWIVIIIVVLFIILILLIKIFNIRNIFRTLKARRRQMKLRFRIKGKNNLHF